MKNCPNCGEVVQDGAKFCGGCASPMPAEAAAPEAPAVEETGAPAVEETAASAAPVEEAPAPAAAAAEPAVASTAPAAEQKKSNMGKIALIGGAGLLGIGAVAGAIGLGVSLLGGGKNNNVYYYKDGEISISTLGKEPANWEITNKLCDEELSVYEASSLSNFMLLSEDGKTLFYPERIDPDSDTFTLYYRDAEDEEAEPVKVDSEVMFYAIDKKAKKVYYVKGSEDDATLYCKTLKDDEKTKIASDVNGAFLSNDDFSRILYTVEEEAAESEESYSSTTYELFQIVDGGDPERIDRGVSYLEHYSDDLTTIYYIKEDSLYYKNGDEEKTKIASDVANVVKIYDSGEVYFTRSNDAEVKLSTYVDDDMKAADAAITKPEYPEYPDYPDSPEYPYWWDYETDEEYEAAYALYETEYAEWEAECERIDAEYDAAYDKYWEDYDLYYEKLDRDDIREQLEDYTLSASAYELCYYNGTDTVTIHESTRYSYVSSSSVVQDSAKLLFEAYEQGEVKKVKMSELGDGFSIYDLQYEVEDALYGSTTSYLAVAGSAFEVDIDFGENDDEDVYIDEKGEYAYYFLDTDESGYEADLYRAPITAEGLGTEEMYDSEVYVYGLSFIGGQIMYYKDVPVLGDEYSYSGDTGDLYVNKELVDYDVAVGMGYYDEEEKVWYYLSDYDAEDEYGTLKVYDGKEAVKIAEDVNDYTVRDDGKLFYIADYSDTYECGTLYYYNDDAAVKIDDDVTCIITVYQGCNIALIDN